MANQDPVESKPVHSTPKWIVPVSAFGTLFLIAFVGLFIYAKATHQRFSSLFNLDKMKAAIKGEKGYDGHLHFLKRGNMDLPEVALTIDDGPHPEWAPKILDALRAHHVHATFFLVGKKVAEHPEIVKRMVDEGNEVGNHSMTHPRFDSISLDQVKQEIVSCQAAIQKAAKVQTNLLRPPGVRYNDKVLALARDLGYTTVAENAGAHDFILEGDYSWTPGNAKFPDRVKGITRDIVKQLKNGTIIDLHDMPATAYAMGDLISAIEAKGFKIVTAGEMIKHLPH
jgi:peptidoglycan/xylan/chitin deacetylase (PgdA/CDA1 family)